MHGLRGILCWNYYGRPMPSRRSPPPWIIEEHTESFIVKDATGQALGYFYFEDEPIPPLASSGRLFND
jgi:hypothetical protein